jgi:hypothetical protein
MIKDTFGLKDFDCLLLAGGSMNLASPKKPGRHETVIDDIDLAVKAHGVEHLILLNHQNCGAYASVGKSFSKSKEEHGFHKNELIVSGKLIASKFPNIKVSLGFVFVSPKDKLLVKKIKA